MGHQAPALEFAFEAIIIVSDVYELGETACGVRGIIPIAIKMKLKII